MGPLGALLVMAAGITAFILLVIFVLVPLFKGIGWLVTAVFRGIGWLVMHVVQFVTGMISDSLRLIGAVLAMIALMPLTMLNVVVGRWSAAGHFANSIRRECRVASLCLYRVLLQRPLRLVLLHGLLEGIEQRVPEAMAAAPAADRPRRRTGQFDGYTIVGSLPGGGSGAKLYIAEPDGTRRGPALPDRVVIKSFALTEGSSLPQIVRESRALECAKQLGLVLEHGMDDHRFFYVMPYHPGDHLGIVTRQLHAESGSDGLGQSHLREITSYMADLLATLSVYHRGGLWHKDVKPENVIVQAGRAHLVDLGLVTPLRSAMTLTTHGTEYFRDPEMVRQVLRGVKVHQVDGAKFDIYALGAVLYFMLENTFPAHGGLSRFSNRSPESLRWIVRRSMTDYAQRYDTADEMLSDLRTVMASEDAFAVRPADLPSMKGGAVPPPIESVARAHTPAAIPDIPAASADTVLPAAPAAVAAAPAIPSAPTARPRLTVVNWWSGAYRVDEAGQPAASPQEPASAFRAQSHAFHQQVHQLNRQVRSGSMSARKAAREQIRVARERAREVRRKATARRHEVTSSRDPSPFLAFLVVFMIVAGTLGGVMLFRSGATRAGTHMPSVSIAVDDGPIAISNIPWLEDRGRPIVLMERQENADGRRVQERVDEIVREYEGNGYDVVVGLDAPELDDLFDMWIDEPTGDNDRVLEDVLEAHGLYGLLHVKTRPGHGAAYKRTDGSLIWSERSGADERRWVEPALADSSLPLLLLNDHPAKNDPLVADQVRRISDVCRERGWILVTDDDIEVSVRRAWPLGPIDHESPLPPVLNRILVDNELAGVLRISAADGDGPPHERISMMLVPADLPAPGSD